MTRSPRWQPPAAITGSRELREHLDACARSAGTEFRYAPTILAARSLWRRSPLLIIGTDIAHRVRGPFTGPGGLLIIAGYDADPRLFTHAERIHAAYVIELPTGRPWLTDRLRDQPTGGTVPGAAPAPLADAITTAITVSASTAEIVLLTLTGDHGDTVTATVAATDPAIWRRHGVEATLTALATTMRQHSPDRYRGVLGYAIAFPHDRLAYYTRRDGHHGFIPLGDLPCIRTDIQHAAITGLTAMVTATIPPRALRGA